MLFVALISGASTAADQAASGRIRVLIEQSRAGPIRIGASPLAASHLIAEFYQRRSFAPAWTRPGQAQAMLALAERSAGHGLDPADYHTAALERMLDPAAQAGVDAAELDLLLTDSLIRLAYHLHFGKLNPRELYPGWNFARSLGTIDPPQALEDALAAPSLRDAVDRYAPQLPQYRELRSALARYRAIEAAGGWPQVPKGPVLAKGMQGERVGQLRARLMAESDAPPSDAAGPARFDDTLEAAVRAFQTQQGLDPTGTAGAPTVEALNVGVAQRIDQIRVNLERLRWVAQDLSGDYLMVDVAGYRARLFLDGRLAWSARVVVGQPYRETPAFRATMRDVVFNPTWTVPPTILREDVLPKLVSDPGWLERNHMRAVDLDGRTVDTAGFDWARFGSARLPYQIVQDAGPANPLGRIKFLLPNPHDVYLHDTPARALFEKTQRAFSSGCIRVERPAELAVLLLDDPARWSAQAVAAQIETGQTRSARVNRAVPVMLLYFTAEADASGVTFRRDVYGRDRAVLLGLNRAPRFTKIDR